MSETSSPIGDDGRELEALRAAPSWATKERAVHELKHSERPAQEIADEFSVSRQTLYTWEQQHDRALDLVWGRPGGLKAALLRESVLAEAREVEHALRQDLARTHRKALLHEIANESLRATRDVLADSQEERRALAVAVERARAASLPLRELAGAIGMSEPTLKRRLAPPPASDVPRKKPGQYERPSKVNDPELRKAVAEIRTQNPTFGPKQIAYELKNRKVNPIIVGHNVVSKILKALGLSRPYTKKERSKRRIEITCPLAITASDLKEVKLEDGTQVFFMPVVMLLFRVLLGFVVFRQFPTSAEVKDAVSEILKGSLDGAVFAHKTDNGTETKGAFRSFLKTHGIWRWTGIPYWPRSNGILERLIETFDLEVLQGKIYATVEDLVAATLAWADRYNVSRPHESLGGIAPLWAALGWLADPLERIRHLEVLHAGIQERIVGKDGRVDWGQDRLFVGRDFAGKTVGLFEQDGWISVWVQGVPLFKITAKEAEAA